MSEGAAKGPDAPARDDEDDHDLLTYGEVRVRLFQEVEAQRAVVAELEERAATAVGAGSDPAGRLDRERARLEALEEAAERNNRQPINDENFERFFGYKGTARRNT